MYSFQKWILCKSLTFVDDLLQICCRLWSCLHNSPFLLLHVTLALSSGACGTRTHWEICQYHCTVFWCCHGIQKQFPLSQFCINLSWSASKFFQLSIPWQRVPETTYRNVWSGVAVLIELYKKKSFSHLKFYLQAFRPKAGQVSQGEEDKESTLSVKQEVGLTLGTFGP